MSGQIQTLATPPPVSVQTLLYNIYLAAASGGSGGTAWGSITGTLSAQTDLQSALDTKLNLAGGTMTGALNNSTNGAASTPAVKLTGTPFTGGTGTTTKPLFLIEPTGTTSTGWSTSGTMLGVNAASGFAGEIVRFGINGAARVRIFPDDPALPTVASTTLAVTDTNNFVLSLTGGAISTSRSDGLYLQYTGTKVVWLCNASVKVGDKLINFNEDVGLARQAAAILRLTNGSSGGGSLEFFERTAPSAPSANAVRLYAEDNGSGKTRLMALFPSGAAQQIAIEP